MFGILDARRLGRNVCLAPKVRATAEGDAERQVRQQNQKSFFSHLRVPSFFSEGYAPVVTRCRIHDWIHDWHGQITTGGSYRLISHRGVDDFASHPCAKLTCILEPRTRDRLRLVWHIGCKASWKKCLPCPKTANKGDAERQDRQRNKKSCFSNLRVPFFFSEGYMLQS